jgi:hypothetical protein
MLCRFNEGGVMKFRICYIKKDSDIEDNFLLTGDDIRDIQILSEYELNKRGVDSQIDTVWSEPL